MSNLRRTVRHEDITINDFIKQTEFQKHASLLKSWKIECTSLIVFDGQCTPLES